MNLLFEGISLLICIGIPVLGGIYFAVKGKGYFLTFLTGILLYIWRLRLSQQVCLRREEELWDLVS